MSRNIHQNGRFIVRTGLLFCVLAALLFSHGEGIQLLPFPVVKTGKNSHQSVNSNKKIPYQFSLHRIDNLNGKPETKSSTGNPNQFFLPGSKLTQSGTFTALLNHRHTDPSYNSRFIPSSPFLSLRSDRAPPVF